MKHLLAFLRRLVVPLPPVSKDLTKRRDFAMAEERAEALRQRVASVDAATSTIRRPGNEP